MSGGHCTTTKPRKVTKCDSNKGKPAELFRTDFISSMKLSDADQPDVERMRRFVDSWRQEWNCGVQVPFDPNNSDSKPAIKVVDELNVTPCSTSKESNEGLMASYDADFLDVQWLRIFNKQLEKLGLSQLTERKFEVAFQHLELAVHGRPAPVENGPDSSQVDDSICEVCRSPNWEDGNEIVFCDNCNVGVHQMCYGVRRIPKGSWYCRPCTVGIQAKCCLCPNKGGALKSTRSCDKWVHVSCALWIPEVEFENKDTMEPTSNLDKVLKSRFSLRCSLCTNRSGACVQCNVKTCRIAFHVTCAQKYELQFISTPKFEVYCYKHSDPSRVVESPPQKPVIGSNSAEEAKEWLLNTRPYFLCSILNLPQYTAQGVFYYWRLKKLSSFGNPLIRLYDSDKMVKREQEEHTLRRIQLLMCLRQNMEKARNLCYMIEKREKYKRQLYNTALEHSRFIYEHYERCLRSRGKTGNNAAPTNGIIIHKRHHPSSIHPGRCDANNVAASLTQQPSRKAHAVRQRSGNINASQNQYLKKRAKIRRNLLITNQRNNNKSLRSSHQNLLVHRKLDDKPKRIRRSTVHFSP